MPFTYMLILNVVNVTAPVLPCILYVGIYTSIRWHYRAESNIFDTTNKAALQEVVIMYLLTKAAVNREAKIHRDI